MSENEHKQEIPAARFGSVRITIDIDTLKNEVAFTNHDVGKSFNQAELAFIVNPVLWCGIKALLENKFEQPTIVAPTATQVNKIRRLH